MTPIEAIGLVLGVVGVAFAFETPRRKFLHLLGLNKKPASVTELPLPICPEVDVPNVEMPTQTGTEAPAPATSSSKPIRVKLRDGSSGSIELSAVVGVEPAMAPTFIGKHGSHPNGMAVAQRLIESTAHAVIESQSNVSALRLGRSMVEHEILERAKPLLAENAISLSAIVLGEIHDG